MLLIVTIIIFFSTQIITTKWQEILILIGVLLFHELGHLVTMKLLKYSEVKMFFIPFFGAAVSGKNDKATAVKSCLVSFMGPFPGIVLGVFLYILFLLTKNYFVFKTAQVMLLLNAFNFLPIMPLDGGRFIDVLFINRRYFRLFFALLGAAFFLMLAASGKDLVLAILGALTVIGAISSFKLHGISRQLKSAGISAASVNDLLDDVSSLQVVIQKLREKYPRFFAPQIAYKAIYNQLKTIVDTIRFVPAKFFSKTVLLLSYLVLVTTSIVVTFFFMAADYREFLRPEVIDGKQYVFVERHLFGSKKAECPINESEYYDGKGTAFMPGGVISGTFFYSNGYRVGEWLSFNAKNETIERRIYDNGRLLTEATLEDGQWRTRSYGELPFLRRCSEEIQRLSQPYKTQYKYFQR